MLYWIYDNKISPLQITIQNQYIINITINEMNFKSLKFIEKTNQHSSDEEKRSLQETIKQLDNYFNGKLKIFDLPIKYKFSPFANQVYKTLQQTEYGKTYTYKDIAILAGSPKAYRAVGSAMKNNEYAIIIPCHRVISSSGEYGRFFNNDNIKEKLIKLEQK